MEKRFYRPNDMPAVLNCSRSTYYRIVREGLLPYSRLYLGGPRVHTPAHIAEYERRLNEQSRPPLRKRAA